LPFFYLAIANLPVIFEPIFTKRIGHSIWDIYHFPKSANGVEFSETWWLAKWLNPIQKLVFVLVPIGLVWGMINTATDRQRKANTIGLAVGIALLIVAIWINATIGQFF
jgi:hypothetical protein